MKTRKSLLAVAVFSAMAAVSSLALAQGGPGMGQGAGAGPGYGQGGAMQGRRAQRAPMTAETVKARLAEVKTALKLRPEQVGPWDAYAAQVQAEAEVRIKMRDEMRAQMQANVDPQVLADQRVAQMKRNAAAAEDLNNRTKELTATFTPEQKATFDRYRPSQRMRAGGPGQGPRRAGPPA